MEMVVGASVLLAMRKLEEYCFCKDQQLAQIMLGDDQDNSRERMTMQSTNGVGIIEEVMLVFGLIEERGLFFYSLNTESLLPSEL
jgi:hypothetical protein